MNVEMEFTDDEICEELAKLGYQNVPTDKLADFKRDLMSLIYTERSKNTSLNSSGDELDEQSILSPPIRENSEHGRRNFTNYDGRCTEKTDYREDWDYRGEEIVATTQGSKSARSGSRVPGSYALFELPMGTHEEDEDDTNCSAREDVSETESDKRCMKRKTVRKTQNGCRNVEESFSESETAGIFEIYEKIKNLAMRDCECERQTADIREPPYRIKGKNACPSVIMKKKIPPHLRNIVRCKPMDRLKMYERLWKKQPPVGEDGHEHIRKVMHAKLLHKDEIHRDTKVYVPNCYIVPTSKLRNDLKWKIRSAMENYEIPAHGFYHEI